MFLTLQIPAIPGDACPIATQALIYGLGFPPSLTLAMNTDEIFNDAGKRDHRATTTFPHCAKLQRLKMDHLFFEALDDSED